jgi:hypothetical protein
MENSTPDRLEPFVTMSGKKLTKEVMIKIMRYLSSSDLHNLSKVNTSFSKLTKHPMVHQETASQAAVMTTASLPTLSTVIESLPFPPPAAIQTTLALITTVANPATASSPVQSTAPVIESTVTVPVLPESLPLIAEVPDVVVKDKEKADDIVEVSQVLAGYAPSYSDNYVPPEVNEHTFTTFANTISFNVSRYPSMTEITDSKSYQSSKKASVKNGESSRRVSKSENDNIAVNDKDDLPPRTTQHGQHGPLQYIPAEYGRSDQAVEARKTATVSAANTVVTVKPEVLASGRLLTHMSPAVRTTNFDEKKSEIEDGND